MKKLTLLAVHSAPFILGIVLSYFFWRSNSILLVIYIVITLGFIRAGKDMKTEFLIALYGMVAGVVVEVLGTQISGYQSFAQPDAGGIPYWLVVSWGFGFVLMKRIGLIVGTGSPWLPRS